MPNYLEDYFRCAQRLISFASRQPLSSQNRYFQFGRNVTCYGEYCTNPIPAADSTLGTLWQDTEINNGTTHLPFDPTRVIDNLRFELYVEEWRQEKSVSSLAELYYFLRPILPENLRKHLQKFYLRGWQTIPFPRWPVDSSVDDLLREMLLLAIRSGQSKQIPFIWFWPEGASSCAIMTHDVEQAAGRDFCERLMGIDESFGIRASFQVVPEKRYGVKQEFLDSIRQRGFEIVIHDLNHDGHLYRTKEHFLERARKINAYGKHYGAEGFRAGVLYRKQLWYDALEFAYDMSVPNVAHLDPQRGGCCTVMPYFIGKVLELPLTTTQDYSLFNILNDYSTELWMRQIELIMQKHGLMSFIVHPDYVGGSKERCIYEELLAQLARLRKEKGVWIALPGEVNHWWRQRAEMHLVRKDDKWRIEGPGSERARIAYAIAEADQLVFTLKESTVRNGTDAPTIAAELSPH
jgi:hypothetical protein